MKTKGKQHEIWLGEFMVKSKRASERMNADKPRTNTVVWTKWVEILSFTDLANQYPELEGITDDGLQSKGEWVLLSSMELSLV